MMDCPFVVGDKVIYVGEPQRDYSDHKWGPGNTLVTGEIYEIRWIGPFDFKNGEMIAVKLFGVTRYPYAPHNNWRDCPFGAIHFRRVLPSTKPAVEALKQLISSPATMKRERV